MKITTEHYNAIKAKVLPLVDSLPAYFAQLHNDARIKDFETRALFDVFHATRIYNDYSYQEFDYQDAHIKTAMRAIFAELNITIQ